MKRNTSRISKAELPLIADTGGLLRALARLPDGKAAWPDFASALTAASVVVIPGLVLAEIDYFLRNERPAMRKLVDVVTLVDALRNVCFDG